MLRRLASGGVIVLALVALAGCAEGGPIPVPSTTATTPSSPTPTTVRTPSGPQDPSPIPTASLIRTQFVGRWAVEIPVDNGPREHAMGKVTTDQNGVPVAYLVAAGDDLSVITDRFGFESHDYLITINQVRRAGYPYPLYAGDTVNLSAYSVTSVGTVNGRVEHNPPPTPLPPQK